MRGIAMQQFRLSIIISSFIILFMVCNAFGGSYYQINGLGKINYITQADILGRGGTSIAIIDRNTINSVNPAGLIFLDLTRISADFYHENNEIKTTTNNGISNYSNLNGVKLSVPLAVNKFVISLGIKPLTRSDFKVESSGELSTGNKYFKQIINKGGVNQFSLGIASGFKNKVFTGLFFNYNFGRVEENWKVDFVSDLFYDTSDKIISTLWGGNITGGVLVKIRPDFYLGGVFSTTTKLTVNNNIEYTTGISSITSKLKMKIPYSWGIGASYILKKKAVLSCDFFNQPWSKLSIDDVTLNGYNNSYRISSGIELIPSTKFNAKFYKKVIYRAGFNYSKLSYQDINGNDVSEYLGTLGLGLPFYEGFGRIDIAFGYGKRGNLDKNNVEENLLQLMISISGGEKWFLRTK